MAITRQPAIQRIWFEPRWPAHDATSTAAFARGKTPASQRPRPARIFVGTRAMVSPIPYRVTNRRTERSCATSLPASVPPVSASRGWYDLLATPSLALTTARVRHSRARFVVGRPPHIERAMRSLPGDRFFIREAERSSESRSGLACRPVPVLLVESSGANGALERQLMDAPRSRVSFQCSQQCRSHP